MTAHADPPASPLPAETEITPLESVEAGVGTTLFAVEPLPSCPFAFCPQHQSAPAVVTAQCHRGRLDNMEAKCISFGGLSIDAAVSREILRVVQPCALDAAALAMTQESHRHDELIEALLLELKAARYAEGLARKQYNAVDPDNRLVASELERRWNTALQKVTEIEARIEQEQLREEAQPDRDHLGGLAVDLEVVWNSPETDVRLKKRIIRTLIEEVVVEIDVAQSSNT